MEDRTRNLRKTLLGTVVSDKMEQTVVVNVERRIPHPRYKRYYKRTSKVVAHDADNSCRVGDLVRVMATRPLSKTKRWRVFEIVKRAE
ncbi:MAG: 30S ribosomal protein S17 [Candidatus Latescibacteria bacterium]|nr:30S ribosomal protein S17 [bacterium]MCB9512947.1 30S ribosomal protein S17 [Candidatus Latescibacterota bacterium]MCB9516392.1 30S ribosomal protein S17 [Candidatus Latescibacterota bacterium]